jgi:hypothetical protein
LTGNVDTDADYLEALIDFIKARKEHGEGLDRAQSQRHVNRDSYMKPFDDTLTNARGAAEAASEKYLERHPLAATLKGL